MTRGIPPLPPSYPAVAYSTNVYFELLMFRVMTCFVYFNFEVHFHNVIQVFQGIELSSLVHILKLVV